MDKSMYLTIVLSPLIAAMVVGFGGHYLGRRLSHSLAILGVFIATVMSLMVFDHHVLQSGGVFNQDIYTWLSVGSFNMSVGFMVDNLTATMMVVVTFVSLMVHIYTIGYMSEDPGYTRFFSYISLFTFAMLMLVMANNFMQLFFGWEAVGLVSYLLIGFWFKKSSAIFANLKAFLVNRVGDFGFLLGIALVLMASGSLDYETVFAGREALTEQVIFGDYSLISVICLLLFVGAMGKSAQIPLHVWLPDSMEGPTPISALIHAATMVTAGIFMVARMSPLFELSDVALTTVMFIGAATALLMGLMGCIQNDIKRVVAYSTLSQLGYMTVALGASAYSVAIFHLVTHAFFKALLFLAAGSVIVALHHQQDMRRMGGLWKKMPITYITCLIGTLALVGMPGFAGFYSKDMIIEAVHFATIPGAANIVYPMLVLGVLITAFYSFRLLFMVFHGKATPAQTQTTHNDGAHHAEVKESPYVITVPLILLAIPSMIVGFVLVEPMLFGTALTPPILSDAIVVNPEHTAMAALGSLAHTPWDLILHAPKTPAFWMLMLGILLAWLLVLKRPQASEFLSKRLSWLRFVLEKGYGFDRFNEAVIASGARRLGEFFSTITDATLIDKYIVNGSAHLVARASGAVRKIQTGYVYHYAFLMIIGLLVMISYFLFLR